MMKRLCDTRAATTARGRAIEMKSMSPLGRFCCKSRLQQIGPWGLSVRAALWRAGPGAFYPTPTLRNAQNLDWWRSRDQRCEPPQVLSDSGQNKLILGASWTTQSKSAESQDALQVCEPH